MFTFCKIWQNWQFLIQYKKRRIKRGLFKSNNGTLINSDLNGAYQIIKKVVPNAFADGIEGVVLHPVRVG